MGQSLFFATTFLDFLEQQFQKFSTNVLFNRKAEALVIAGRDLKH
jgi:hypothetical protein